MRPPRNRKGSFCPEDNQWNGQLAHVLMDYCYAWAGCPCHRKLTIRSLEAHVSAWGTFLLLALLPLQAGEPDARQGESAAAAARPLAGVFGGSETDSFRKAVSAIPDLQVFEGLPDPKTESALFAKESVRSDVMSVGNFKFYKQPLPMSDAEIAELRAVFSPGNPFSPGGGQDPCGRFHPDYVLVWRSGDSSFYAQIGLGCQEIDAVGGSVRIHSYIPTDIYARLNRVLGKYSVNRPQASSEAGLREFSTTNGP